MADFDFKKYLAQSAHMDDKELAETILKEQGVGAGLNEYLEDIHTSGAQILSSYVSDDEVGHLLAAISGISCGRILSSKEVDPATKVQLAVLMTKNPALLKTLTMSVMCAAVGMSAKEDWR